MQKKKQIAIFISGTGSNATNIIRYFKFSEKAEVRVLLSNKPEKGANAISLNEDVDLLSFQKEELINSTSIVDFLKEKNIDLVVLAGFLLKIPETMVKAFPNKIINVHPALLPKFGGKGMYGRRVHQAVFSNKEKESGITIHYVNEYYDEGNIIEQFSCEIEKNDSPESIENKVRALEKKYFAQTIEKLISE